jgi:anti-sigma B factor antagonist
MPLKIGTREVNGVTVVDCTGRIVFGDEAFALRDTVKALLGQPRSIVLNLAGVTYIDSGGLGTLVGLYTSAQNAGGSLKLASLNNRVIDLLQITKLVTVFDCFETVDDATKSFIKTAGAA